MRVAQSGAPQDQGTALRYLDLSPEGRKVVERVASSLQVQAEELLACLDGEEVSAAPLVGRVAAGLPDEADEHRDGWVPFPAAWAAGGSCFALQVAGDSMMLAGILDGDTAIVRRQETARSGEIVAATVEQETTLKRYLEEGDTRLLVAEHADYRSIDIGEKACTVHGRVVGLLRAYR